MNTLDLNKLRETILEVQERDEMVPAGFQQKVFVDRNARIHLGEDGGDMVGPVTEIQQDTFHARSPNDVKEAQTYLPPDTRRDRIDGFDVWTYTVNTEFGVPFLLSAYFDGEYYQVKVCSPEIEDAWMNPHTGHVFPDGRICFGVAFNSGRRTLRDAYSKSVLWANGIAAMLHGADHFPFSINNLRD